MTEKLLEYFKGDELAAGVWLGKYAYEGEKTPEDMHKRMAKEFTRVEWSHCGEVDYTNIDKLYINIYMGL